MVRAPLEGLDLSLFARLEPGDMVFLDGSHRVFMNADTVAFFLEVLPALADGVLVGVHDIRLPDDYAPEIADRWYSEQYLLACWLLAESPRVTPLVPAAYISHHTTLGAVLDPLWASPGFEPVERHGDAFWFVTADDRPRRRPWRRS